MFLLFLFKSKTRQRKSLGLPLTNYNINPHQHVSELFCIFRCGFSYLVIHSRKTPTLHSNTCIWEASGLVIDYTLHIHVAYKEKPSNWLNPHTNHYHWMIWIFELNLLAISLVKPNFLLLFFWGIIWTTEAHFTYFVLSK